MARVIEQQISKDQGIKAFRAAVLEVMKEGSSVSSPKISLRDDFTRRTHLSGQAMVDIILNILNQLILGIVSDDHTARASYCCNQ